MVKLDLLKKLLTCLNGEGACAVALKKDKSVKRRLLSIICKCAACCSVLQRVAACFSVLHVLQCAAVCFTVLHRAAVYCIVLQHVAPCCSLLHRVATCCSKLQCGLPLSTRQHALQVYACTCVRAYVVRVCVCLFVCL